MPVLYKKAGRVTGEQHSSSVEQNGTWAISMLLGISVEIIYSPHRRKLD